MLSCLVPESSSSWEKGTSWWRLKGLPERDRLIVCPVQDDKGNVQVSIYLPHSVHLCPSLNLIPGLSQQLPRSQIEGYIGLEIICSRTVFGGEGFPQAGFAKGFTQVNHPIII